MRLLALISLGAAFLCAQTGINPNISVIGDFQINQTDSTTDIDSGAEIALQGYVNPFARADVFIDVGAGGSMDLETAILTIERSLPWGLGLRSGIFLVPLGRINTQHTHLYPFIQTPIGFTGILGEDAWSSPGLELSWLPPLPWYSQILAGWFQHGPEIVGASLPAEKQLGLFRWIHFLDMTPVTHLVIGMSGAQSSGKLTGDRLSSVDAKIKWRRDKNRSITMQAEYLSRRPRPDNALSPDAAAGYAWVNFQFYKVWNAGILWDQVFDSGNLKNGTIFAGYSPAEETMIFRLAVTVHNGTDSPNSPTVKA